MASGTGHLPWPTLLRRVNKLNTPWSVHLLMRVCVCGVQICCEMDMQGCARASVYVCVFESVCVQID